MSKKSMMLSKKPMVFIGFLVSIVIIIAGYFYYTSVKDSFREEKYEELKAIADMKIDQILKWRQERIADAKVISQSAYFEKAVAQWIQSRDNRILRGELKGRLTLVQKEFNYEDICITTTKGEFLLSLKERTNGIDSIMKGLVIETTEKREIVFSDFYKCPFDGQVHLTISSPLINDNEVFAVLVFILDPNEYIFPLIQSWPTPSKTAETILLRKEGDSVVFINELRHRSNTALEFRVPLTDKEIPAVQVVFGNEGIFEGEDYRGEEVLSDINKIPDSPWFMVAKIDKSEVYSTLRNRTGVIIGFVSLLIFVFSLGLAFIYNYRQTDTYKELYLKEKELADIHEEFRTTLYSIGDGVITTDTNGCVRFMNHVAEELTGWSEFDAAGKQLGNVFKIVNEDSNEKVESPVDKILREGVVIGLANHTVLIHKKGKQIPIADSGAPIHDEKKNITGVVLVFRDQTEEREHQKALLNSEEQYKGVVDNIAIGVALISPDMEILTLNKQMQEWFPNTDVSSRPICYKAFYIPPREEICSYCLTCKTLEDGLVHEVITETQGKDGILNYRIISSPIKDNNGKVIAAIEMVEDVTERTRWEKEILNSREQLQSLSSHLQTIREDERGKISREIHDDLGQSLTALKMDMSWFRKHLHEGNNEKKINGMIDLVDETIKSVQRISTELRPGLLDDIGFSSAVKWFMSEFEERSGLKCKLNIKPDEIVLDEKLSIAMYRIFQESLTNVARHAKASKVNVNIALTNNTLEMIVDDNGIGIDETKLKDPKSIGLIGMQERVYLWHGNVEIKGEKGKGTVVRVNVKF